jgi:glutathione S-transferase
MAMPRLVTIPFSHFCDKARWGLDRARIAYVEEGHLPLFAWLPALRAGRSRTVPTLVTSSGAITDSTDILKWCDEHGGGEPLFPPGNREVVELEDRFDKVWGPHTRRLAYHHLLPALRERIDTFRGVPRHEVAITKTLAPLVSMMMRRGLRIDDAGVQRSQAKVDEIVAEVDARLADGRPYLCGDRFTAADLTFAALATPLVIPPELGDVLPIDDPPPGLAALRDHVRGTAAGAFALRMYAAHRGVSPRSARS